MKTFEIPSMGGLMLTKENKDQISFFPENVACVTYKNVEDIRLKINKIKNNPKKYEKIIPIKDAKMKFQDMFWPLWLDK